LNDIQVLLDASFSDRDIVTLAIIQGEGGIGKSGAIRHYAIELRKRNIPCYICQLSPEYSNLSGLLRSIFLTNDAQLIYDKVGLHL